MAVTTAAKCTFFYKQGDHGWSETYYCLKTIQAAYDSCLILGNALIRMRGRNTSITALRISLVACPTNQEAAPRQSQLFPPQPTWAQGGAVIAPANPGGNQSDSFSACILARCIPQTPQIGTKSIFMGGMPDRYDIEGGKLYGSFEFMYGTDITRALQVALASGGFGWLGQTASPAAVTVGIKALILGFRVPRINPSGNLLVNSPDLVNKPGLYFPVRISGMRQPGNLNGTWPVTTYRPDGETWNGFIFQKPIATLPWDNSGTITYAPKNFIPFSQALVGVPNPVPEEVAGNIYAVKIAKRKRGRPFGQQPGRGRTIPVA